MSLWKRLAVLLVAVATVAMLGTACEEIEGVVGPTERPTIKLSDTQFDSIWLINGIVKFVVEEGYGYPVEMSEVSTAIAYASISSGDLDVLMELWQQNVLDVYEREIAAGNIENLGAVYEAGPQFWLVPQWVADQHNVITIEDLKRPDVVQLFENPENPDKGAFINCITGWECAEINYSKFRAYGLDEYYDIIEPGSVGAMDAALIGPMRASEPVFGYYWAPTPIAGMFDWHIIEEPPYTDECWEEVVTGQDDVSYTPAEACAYEDLPIDIGAHSGLRDKAPDVVELLENMTVGLNPLNETLAWAAENDVDTKSEETAVYYLRTYPERWTTWMPAENAEKVQAALDERS